MSVTRWVYDHSPVFWQNVMCSVSGAVRQWQRYRHPFGERRAFFCEAGKWSRAHAEDYQTAKVREMLQAAYDAVPFYRDRFEQVGLRPDEVRSLADLARLPLLSKDEVRRAGNALIAAGYNSKRLVVSHSGGSTGMPLTCYHGRDALVDLYASFWAYQRPGVQIGDPYATFQGLELIPPRQAAGPYWRMNRAANQRLYSIFHLSERTISEYIEDLDRFKPVYVQGYANSLYLLAKLAREKDIDPKWAPKAVFSTSEQLLPVYHEVIESVFRTKVWDAYSQDEGCGSITQYECGYYHYDRAYGYMEFLDQAADGTRKLAEIVCTGFLNKAWPLIRYRVGDMVEYEDVDACPKCGRAGPIIHEIRGRTGDVLVTPSGRAFPHISLIVKNLHGVRQVQLVQEAKARITIRFVPSEDFRESEDERLILSSFAKAIHEPVDWSLERVEEIPRTRSGKFMSIVSNISP